MRRIIGFSCLALMALALAGCDVQVQDQTPGTFTANQDIGMYPLTVKVTSGALVSTPVYVFVLTGDGQQVPLSAGPNGTYGTMYPVKCKQTFPLQYLAVWRVQGVVTKHQLFPPQPREIQLTPPPLTQQANVDTSGTPDKKTHAWQGAVQYNIITAPDAHITGAQVQPVSQDPADVKAAQAVSVVSTLPIDASCGTPTAVTLATKAQTTHVNLVITTDLPGVPQATTRVDFAPQQQ
ncbi:MAG TPA: hypothetical protein VGG63_12435 [Steroidobacteraceae bacterium]